MNKKILLLVMNFSVFLFLQCEGYISNKGLFGNKRIVILGGTGYLGRAIATEVIKYNPQQVVIFSRDEVKHFQFAKELSDKRFQHIIGDIRDYEALLKATKGADIVFHVAALKRMDALEKNVEEAIKTNVLATLNVKNACIANEVDKVLFISTDKACLPINAYGACKFVSEKIFTNYDKEKIRTKFIATRFGNILQSTGSVIPFFVEKIKKNENITLTDERMTRFIIDKGEAVELIFDAIRYGIGGEIFVKKLPAMKITDLIDVLKKAYSTEVGVDIIGLRPGEKLHEVLINKFEAQRTIQYKDFLIVLPSVDSDYYTLINPEYLSQGKKIYNQSEKYSSDLAVIPQSDITKLFKELKLI